MPMNTICYILLYNNSNIYAQSFLDYIYNYNVMLLIIRFVEVFFMEAFMILLVPNTAFKSTVGIGHAEPMHTESKGSG